jgi:Na+/proline symporter
MNREDTERLLKIRVSSSDKEYAWVKNVVSVISILLGVLISLKDKSKIHSEIESILFIVTITSFGLCILCGLIFLFADSDTEHRVVKKVVEKEYDKDVSNGLHATFVERRPIFGILRIGFFLTLLCSVLSLVAYAVYPEF